MNPYELAEIIARNLEISSLSNITEHEKTILCVVEVEVNNGGFSQYYFNSAGSLANFAPEAFTKIGAHNTAKIIVSANAKFGAWVPEGRFDRQEVLEVLENDDVSWDTLDNKFYEYPDDIERLLTAYANQ